MLTPQLIRPSSLLRLIKPWHIALIVGAFLIGLAARYLPSDTYADTETVYLPELKAEVEMLRDDPYQGPTDVRACLYDRNFKCDDRWLPYDAIDVIAKRNPRRGEAFVRGCVYLQRDRTCLCEPHDFILPLTRMW